MSATYHNRIQRLRRLQAKLPRPGTPEGACLMISQLLLLLPDCYGEGPDATRRRAMQRDLDELEHAGLAEVINPGGKPQRYRQVSAVLPEDEADWQYVLSHIHDLVHDLLPQQRLDRVWQRLLRELDGPLLDERKLRLVPDNLRLCPPAIYAGVLEEVLTALLKECVLEVLYENARGERGTASLHPQGLVQRGPTPYLFALKNDETAPLRLYALHRMIRAQARLTEPARKAAGFDLDRAITSGQVDFGTGKVIDLELRVRGYVAEVLRVCPLTPGQCLEDEAPESPFTVRVRARVPETGALWRWLLGLGANVEVVAPDGLRQVMRDQTLRMTRLYTRLNLRGEAAAWQFEQGTDIPGHGNPSPPDEGAMEQWLMSDWFDAGAEVAAGHGERYPPLDDADAQRWWLGGYGTAWALGSDARPVTEALAAALRDQEALREQLGKALAGKLPK